MHCASPVPPYRLAARPVGSRTNGLDNQMLVFESRFESGNLHARRSNVFQVPTGHCVTATSLLFRAQIIAQLFSLTCRSLFARFAHFSGPFEYQLWFTMTSIHKSTQRHLHGVSVSSGCFFDWGCTSFKLPYGKAYEYNQVPYLESSALSICVFIECFRFIIRVDLSSEFRIREDTRSTDLP